MEKFTCKTCCEEKNISEFYKTPSGHRHTCKKCLTQRTVHYQRENPEIQRWKQIKHRYGMTKEQYLTMLVEQGYKCPVCGTGLHIEAIKRTGKRPPNQAVIDHCHSSGHVRGILCHNCNVAIGHFKDDVEIIKNAIQYLEGERDACDVLFQPA